MKKKTEKDYQRYLSEVIKNWIPLLNLQAFVIKIEKDNREQYLACRFRFPYMDAQILWTTHSFECWRDKDPDQEHEIVHELCHIITDPFYAKAKDRFCSKNDLEAERERLTDTIAAILYKTHRKI